MGIRLKIANQLHKRMDSLRTIRIRSDPRPTSRKPVATHRLEHVNRPSKRHNRIIEPLRISEAANLLSRDNERAAPVSAEIRRRLKIGYPAGHPISFPEE
jgi:hypothetical protein